MTSRCPWMARVGVAEPGDDRLQHHGRVVSRPLPLPLPVLDDVGRLCITGPLHERLQLGLELSSRARSADRLPVG
jgi:hypothetical protein